MSRSEMDTNSLHKRGFSEEASYVPRRNGKTDNQWTELGQRCLLKTFHCTK